MKKWVHSSFSVKAFITGYAIGDIINQDLLTDKQRQVAIKTGMVRIEQLDTLLIWRRIK